MTTRPDTTLRHALRAAGLVAAFLLAAVFPLVAGYLIGAVFNCGPVVGTTIVGCLMLLGLFFAIAWTATER